MTDYKDVIREVALKNRASIQEDDVLMVVVTVMNKIVDDQIAALTGALQGHRDECQGIALAWREDAANRANQILNVALDAGRQAMAKSMHEGAVKVVDLVRGEYGAVMAEQKAELTKAVADFRRYANVVTAAVGVGLVGSVLIAIFL